MIEILGSSGMYVVIGIIVIAVASLFGLVVFASKEEKFEDVVEAQKKEQEALLQSLNATTSKPSKSKRKWAKIKSQKSTKSGEKKDVQNDEPEAETVEENVSEASAEISLPSTESKSKKATKKRKGNEKAKGKNNVDGKKREALEELIEQAQFQFESKEPEPVIEPEKKPKESKKDATKIIVSEIIAEIKETAELSQAPAEVIKKEKPNKPTESVKKSKAKKGKSQAVSNEDKIAADKIAKDLENSQFNAPDVQRLIDILLDKQNEQQQWQMPNKKTDVVEDLRNKCHGLEEHLTEEKKTSLAAAHENKELRLEIQHERSQFQKFQTQANQKITQQGGEIQALQKRMEMTQESHLHEMQKAQGQLQQMKEVIDQSAPVEMQRLKEENVMLKNASLRSQQLSDEKNSLVAEYSQIQQSSKNLRAELDSALMQLQQHSQQMQLYEEQNKAHENEIQKLRMSKNETENILSSKVAELKDQLVRYEREHSNLQQKLQVAQGQLESTKLEKETLVTKSAASSVLEQKLSSSMKDIESLTQSLKTSEETVKQYQEVKMKNSELLKQLAEEKQQLQEKINQEKDEMVIIEKPPSNGLCTDVQVSHEEHLQLITEKDKVISELKDDVKSTKEELERLVKVMDQEKQEKDETVKELHHSKHDLEDKFSHLEKDLDEMKADKKKIEEVVEQSKSKNNDLREKNWKAMDALATAETNSKKKVKETEETVFRVLKKIRPSIKLERNQPLDAVLQHYQEAFLRGEEEIQESAKNSDEIETLTKEKDQLKGNNEELKEQLNESKKTETMLNQQLKEATENTSSSAENMKKVSEENKKANIQIEHYKEVLEETEGMLKKLQTGVESQVASYEKKLTEKDHELHQLKDKTIKLEETLKNNDDKSQLELDLKNIQSDLESEKKAKLELESELDEAKKKMTDMESHIEISHSEDSLAQSQESLDSSVGSTSPKKKKGFRHAFSKAFQKKSEGHDDAKHQHFAVQEQLSKIEAEKTELAKKLGSVSDSALAKDEEIKKLKTSKESLDRELSKLKEKLDIVDKAGKDSGKSDKEKDKIIAKLTLENAELREDLRDERDRVVVDVESADSEQLKADLDSLKQKYDEEKDSSKKLNTSLHELEDQLKSQKEELNKKSTELTEWEQKYKDAADQAVINEQKIQELELAGLTKSERIELEIDEAINQTGNSPTSPQRTIGAPLLEQLDEVKSSLSEKEQQLESEQLANKQLRSQLAALASHASHGTSV